MTRPFLTGLISVVLSGCMINTEEPLILPAPNVIQENVDTAFQENDPILGLTILEGAKKRHPSWEWGGQWEQGVSLVEKAFYDAMEKGDYRAALRNYRSLKALGLDDNELGADGPSLLKKLIFSLIEEDNAVPALTLLVGEYGKISFSEEDLTALYTVAQKEQHMSSLKLLQDSLYATEPVQEMLDPEKARMLLNGVATIWVDRGIKVDQGVGLPDRVIGSGFFIDTRGYLLTNHHVISSEVDPAYEGYSRLYVRLPEAPKEKIPAKVIGWDTILDIALLKVEYTPKYVFSLTDTELGPGERIFAIGSPGGLESTITSGIVSATDRRLLQLGDTTQIDVPINHGNSGGPLIDERGNVVGVVFAGLEAFEGINFAIPGKYVNLIIDKLYKGGSVEHPWLGVALYERREGLEVLYVFPGSNADLSGIQKGDIITALDGYSAPTIGEYQYSLMHRMSGELLNVSLLRDSEELTVLSALGTRPESPFGEAFKKDAKKNLILPLFGFDLEEAGATLWERRYRVTRILTGMSADETGLSVNDPFVLRSIDTYPDEGIVLMSVIIKKRKAGFLESSIQLGAMIDSDYFL